MAFSQLRIIMNKGDELDIRPILETNQLVLRLTISMPTAGRDGEVFRDPGWKLLQLSVGDENDDVIEVGRHYALG